MISVKASLAKTKQVCLSKNTLNVANGAIKTDSIKQPEKIQRYQLKLNNECKTS